MALERLDDLATGLERDVSAGESAAARRYAARIATALEEARTLVPSADGAAPDGG